MKKSGIWRRYDMAAHLSRTRLLWKKLFAVVLSLSLLLPFEGAAVLSAETPQAVYNGSADVFTVLQNIQYSDLSGQDNWTKEAIYETGALNLMKGFGAKQFGIGSTISKEQAIAIAYRAAGREADAQKAAEALDNARNPQDKKTNPISMWSDGYLQLAAKEGLISKQDLNDAFNPDQTQLNAGSFYRGDPAQRQEMAYWMAKAIGLAPVYGQQKLFNSYNDWEAADPVKIPYIEAVLQNNIMSGSIDGYFLPKESITREQAAQVIKNAEAFLLPKLGMGKKTGSIESIDLQDDYSNGYLVARDVYNIRTSSGKLDKINTEYYGKPADAVSELDGYNISGQGRDFIVYKNGMVGTSSLLEKGDRIEYIYGADGTVKFANVLSSVYDTKYIAANIKSIDPSNMLISVSKLFVTDSPDLGQVKDSISFDLGNEEVEEVYTISNAAQVIIGSQKSSLDKLTPGMSVVLTVKNGVVDGIREIYIKPAAGEEAGIVSGIVEDNNPALGYITLYYENGTGTSPENYSRLITDRTYNYSTQGEVETFKNHRTAKPDAIEPGDSAFLKLDDNGRVVSMSAVDNYTVKYGKVVYKKPGILSVQYDNGGNQVLQVGSGTIILSGGKIASFDDIKDGDRVKLLLGISNSGTVLKEITVEGSEHFIKNIYKGMLSYLDDISGRLIIQNLCVFNNGDWVRTDQKGVTGIKLSDRYDIYMGEKQLDSSYMKYLKGNEAYIAVENDYGGGEKAVVVSLRNNSDNENIYSDSVSLAVPGAGEFRLSNTYRNFKYNAGTIVVKDGRLVRTGSISEEDPALVVANRSDADGEFYAGVVKIDQKANSGLPRIYRGRIKQINEDRNFTLESFSQLNGMRWEYFNTPKTLKLGTQTRILDDNGLVNQRDFMDYGTDSYKDRVVYVVADEVNAIEVSTVPYGAYNIKGTIYELTYDTQGQGGTVASSPSSFKLKDVKLYDQTNMVWNSMAETTVNILPNSIIIKNGGIIKADELKKEDKLRVIKKDAAVTGDGYIIMVEN